MRLALLLVSFLPAAGLCRPGSLDVRGVGARILRSEQLRFRYFRPVSVIGCSAEMEFYSESGGSSIVSIASKRLKPSLGTTCAETTLTRLEAPYTWIIDPWPDR